MFLAKKQLEYKLCVIYFHCNECKVLVIKNIYYYFQFVRMVLKWLLLNKNEYMLLFFNIKSFLCCSEKRTLSIATTLKTLTLTSNILIDRTL